MNSQNALLHETLLSVTKELTKLLYIKFSLALEDQPQFDLKNIDSRKNKDSTCRPDMPNQVVLERILKLLVPFEVPYGTNEQQGSVKEPVLCMQCESRCTCMQISRKSSYARVDRLDMVDDDAQQLNPQDYGPHSTLVSGVSRPSKESEEL